MMIVMVIIANVKCYLIKSPKYVYIVYMVQVLPAYPQTIPTSLCQNMLWWRSFFTMLPVWQEIGLQQNLLRWSRCCTFSSSAYNYFYRIGCRNFSFRFTAWYTYLSYTGVVFSPLRRLGFHLTNFVCFLQTFGPRGGVHTSREILPLILYSLPPRHLLHK